MNLTTQSNLTTTTLHMAMELSNTKWRLAFGNRLKIRQVVIDANDLWALKDEISKAKKKFSLPQETKVISCYEAGRDGFWIHRLLEESGIKNYVLDSSSIAVHRKFRRAKTDRLDAEKLLKQLIRYEQGEEKLQVARVPSEEEEDRRRMHRERERLIKERTGHTNRVRSLLNLHGIKAKTKGKQGWEKYINEVLDWKGQPLPVHQKEELLREVERLNMVAKQLKELELSKEKRFKTSQDAAYRKVEQLELLKGVGKVSSWVLVMEWFSWREFKNRREVGAAAGLVGSPYDSGDSQREQGITKAGNNRIRALMIELAWSWLRYQPDSELSKWFDERFNHSKRSRKVGIVALARRLLIAIWRYVTTAEIPKGALIKPA